MRLAALLLGLTMLVPLASGQETHTVTTAPRVRFETTLGNFVVELDRVRAPLTVETFLKNVEAGFYDGLIFHRVVAGFIAQAGAYTVDLTAKPASGTVVNESGNGLSNLRGTIGYARNNDPHSGTTQFYVNLADNIDLDPRPTRWGYTVFGKVIEGMEVVDQIGHKPTGGGGPFDRGVPVEPIVIQRAELIKE